MTTESENSNGSLPGFRLSKLELRNWGTFDKYIWTISPNGNNALLTGDIGSGKSTIVDAITTLLVPYQKIVYNKAAGADSKERTPYSYVLGAYKNEKVESSGKSQDVFLRDESCYSVILGHFINEDFNKQITLGQVFWIRNGKAEKFFVISSALLSINPDFSDFGSDIAKLKKRLKQSANNEVYDAFSEYSSKFRQHFGIKQAEALDLFNQTVSMKSVGNLTDFVRDQMLGKTLIREKIEELVKSYEELTKAHDTALKAQVQKEMLEPLMVNIEQLRIVSDEIETLYQTVDEIPKWFSLQRVEFLKIQLLDLADDYFKNQRSINQVVNELDQQRTVLRQLESKRDGMQVTSLLLQIDNRIETLEEEKERRIKGAKKYETLCKSLDLPLNFEEDSFYSNQKNSRKKLEETENRLSSISKEKTELHVRVHALNTDISELGREITSLRSRKTKIPGPSLALREQILEGLNLDKSTIPFVGELIQIKTGAREWEGAIERRLRDLGLSILVADRYYKLISEYVDSHHLKGKLVYLRVFERKQKTDFEVKSSSLVHKVEVKSDSEFYDWVSGELEERHNYICCKDLEEFHREPYAITREGQIKSGKVRHEKNDSRRINDHMNYILGWSNVEKIEAFEAEQNNKLVDKNAIDKGILALESEEEILSTKRDLIRDLLQFNEFKDINFSEIVNSIQKEREQRQKLKESSKEFEIIQEQIESVDIVVKQKDDQKDLLQKEKGKVEDRISANALKLKKNLGDVNSPEAELIVSEEDIFKDLNMVIERWISISVPVLVFSETTMVIVSGVKISKNIDDLDSDEKALLTRITGPNGNIDKKRNFQSRIEKEIVLTMERYLEHYQSFATDVDASLESISEFETMFQKLVQDDIPRHEERFKKLLKEGTIHGILVFQNQLESSDKEIESKIAEINKHLVAIPYSNGTYIKITQDIVSSKDIGDFKNDLRACLENIYGETDNYNEAKFLQVKKILDRFKGTTDEDRRWTDRVTDVRQWYTFGASELYQEDHTEKEYYSDSSGKSGGQKEKLAYTILASAIAFQFGLSWDENRSKSFRFVVIDEAFGRGSDESTRYGLKLFKKLNLQLLIVTPLQKINIIEDYINAVHFVSNSDGKYSMVRNITKEEFLAEKQKYFASLEQSK